MATTAAPATSPVITAPALDTLEGRIAAAKSIINEHLTKSTPDREMAWDKTIPAQHCGLVIRFKYNEHERVFAKNWSDADLQTFLENQAETFLRNSSKKDPSQDILQIESIIFQKTSDSKINYFNPYTVFSFIIGVTSGAEAHRKNIPISGFESRMFTFLPIKSERTAILKTFAQLPELHE